MAVDVVLARATQVTGMSVPPIIRRVATQLNHNLARTAEALLMWRADEPACLEIAYLATQITKESQLWPDG